MKPITRAQWEAKGRELFGDNQENWRFVCPSCGKEQSIAKVRSEHAADLPVLRAGNYALEQECIGRHLPAHGCDWAAYGLLHGPVFVDGLPVFDFAGKPFSAGSAW